jgi:hypothetical protein
MSCPTDDVDGIVQSRVCGRAGRAEVLEAAEHIEMPFEAESGIG